MPLIEAIGPAATQMSLSHSEKGMKRAYAERDTGRLERAPVEMEKVVGLTSAEYANGTLEGKNLTSGCS